MSLRTFSPRSLRRNSLTQFTLSDKNSATAFQNNSMIKRILLVATCGAILLFVTATLVFFTLSLVTLASASDIGFATHYHSWESLDPEYNLGYTPFAIPKATVGTWVRSDIGWKDIETTQGAYKFAGTADDQWIKALQGAGQKVVALFNQNYNPTFYAGTVAYTPDASGLSPATKFLVALAKQYAGIVIELGNEIQFSASTYWGTNWEQGYVNWATEATNAIHAAVPSAQVIGYCAQGQQILDMLAMGGAIDGVVFHAYNTDLGPNKPVVAWPEGYGANDSNTDPYRLSPDGFKNFVLALQAYKKPIWITEQGQNSGMSEYACADWDARRLAMALWLKVDHIGFYQLLGGDSGRSVWTYDYYSRWANAVINRVYDLLGSLMPDSSPVTAIWNAVDNPTVKATDFIGLDFSGPSTGGNPPATTIAVAWFGHVFLKGPYGSMDNVITNATITATHSGAGAVTATDLVTGDSWPVQFTQNGAQMQIAGQVSQHPIAYVIGPDSGPVAPPPVTFTQGSESYSASTSSLSVTFKKPQQAGDTLTIVITHASAQSVASVGDISGGDHYTQTASSTTNGITTETRTATKIVGLGWNDTAYVNFSAATQNPSMTVTETMP